MRKKPLPEVTLVRVILIILLVMYHSFLPWVDDWGPRSFGRNTVYFWIAKASYSFLLPLFVFISGYIWSYQHTERGEKESLSLIFRKKSTRLLVPCYIFGVFYLYCFTDMGGGKNAIITQLLSGIGHLWFLPMLFWIFIFAYILLLIKNSKSIVILTIFCFLFSIVPIPFGVSYSLYYILYFIAGYMLYRYRTWLLTFDMFSLVLLWLLYLVLFATTTQFLEYILLSFDNTLNKIVSYTLRNILMNIYAWIGMISMFVTAMKYTNKYGVSKIIEELGELCFGVYIFQQFILQFLYYYTPIPDYVNPLYLPWIGFSITLLTSIILTYIIKKTKLRFFI